MFYGLEVKKVIVKLSDSSKLSNE